nr:hypothetical protein [Tanacetum cinerariifolium]
MSVVYVLTTPMSEDEGDNPTVKQNVKTFKELWDTLEAKYIDEDASSKKFLVSNFTNYKMTDSRPVLEHYNELFGILEKFTQHKMNMDESIQISCIIDKLLPSWKDFKHTLKHLKEELTLVELDSHLRIKESIRADKRKHHDTKADPNKKPKVTCWKCEKPGYLKKNCKAGSVGNKANRSSTKVSVDGFSNSLKGHNMFNKSLQVYYVTCVSEAYFMQDDDVTWWVDSEATVHVCKDRCWFKIYESLNDRSILHVRNESTALVHRRGCVDLRGIKCIFVGYVEHFKAFRFYVIEPNDSVAINSIVESRNVIIDENRFSSVLIPSQRSLVNRSEDIGGSVVPEKVTEEKKAINDEIDSIMGNNTWVLTDLPPGCRPLSCKWIFKIKLKVPKQWHQQFNEVVLSNDYLHNQADKCVYSNFDESGKEIIISLDVDDMLIFGTDQVQIDLTNKFLSSRFSTKGMREADVILVSTHMDTNEKLMPNNGQAVSQLEYTSNHGTQHWQAIQRVLKYLKKTMNYRLIYTGYPLVLEGYTYASWISNTEDNSFTSESEFVDLEAASKEAEWLKNFLFEAPLWVKPIAPISIRCDSAATLAKAYSQMYNEKSRYLGVRHSMIRELITNGVVFIKVMRSQQNLVDHLTKGLARALVIKSAEGMGLKSNQVTEC